MSIILLYLMNSNFMAFFFLISMIMLMELNNLFMWMLFMLFLMMKIIFFSMKEKMNMFYFNFKSFLLKILFLMMILFLFSNFILMFYLSFEIISLLMFFLIYFSSFSFMRLKASMYLFLIMGVGTFPMILIIFFLNEKTFLMIFFISFLIKMPLMFFHLWLPKAHVEANYYDSMILASLLLKLGSYGMLILDIYNNFFFFFGVFGGLIFSFMVLKILDIKMIMALSSIIHMNMSLMFMFSFSFFIEKFFYLMMLSHALTSSLMFFMVGMIYEQSYSRNILMNKSFMLNFYNFFLFIFILLFCNMGMPPFMTFFYEVYMYISFLNFNFNYLMLMISMIFFSSFFNILLLKNISMMTKNKFFKMQNFKINSVLLIHEHFIYLIIFI